MLCEYSCCGKKWERLVKFNSRDRVRCSDCGKLASRAVSNFSVPGATYVGTDRFKGAEAALGVKGIESAKDIDKICEEHGVHPVDPYFRQAPIPEPKPIPDKAFMKYLD